MGACAGTEPVSDRVKIIYILGYGRSGSTILNALLDQHPELTGVGELVNLVLSGVVGRRLLRVRATGVYLSILDAGERSPGASGRISKTRYTIGLCNADPAVTRVSCRLPATLATRSGRERFLHSTKALLDAIGEVSGCQTLVDSSKVPGWLLTLARLPDVDLRVIHLIRDGRGAVWVVGEVV